MVLGVLDLQSVPTEPMRATTPELFNRLGGARAQLDGLTNWAWLTIGALLKPTNPPGPMWR